MLAGTNAETKDADDAMSEVLGVPPESMDFGVHEAGILQSDRVHSVGDVRDAKALEHLQDCQMYLHQYLS